MGPLEAHDLISAGAVLVDVREDDEWALGHAPGAVHIPMGGILDQLDALPADRMVICVCHRGGRSSRVVEALRPRGIDARNLDGGMLAWFTHGLAVLNDQGEPGLIEP
ncbi:MAG: rhodanese-like domain-containing protein [Acidimicrobiales bacterium]